MAGERAAAIGKVVSGGAEWGSFGGEGVHDRSWVRGQAAAGNKGDAFVACVGQNGRGGALGVHERCARIPLAG